MSHANIIDCCSVLLADLGFGNETLESLIMKWRFLVGQCREGYEWDYSEYKNEIRARCLINELQNCPSIYGAIELKWFFNDVALLDEEFKSLLQPGVDVNEGGSWWERGVLSRAGDEYRCYMANAHRVSVERIKD
ncbi:hypothetical protein [Pseudomonas quasicaspiana]|uniref:hypothetical protein n=1 Tax=Pseudomonas quasicaspiana TaxID=2829821 RepID=UPI001E383B19|nr:hypothetical protein [Pseudomonas quasicaspiana]MCD5976537.1 hypothetical protein [Pseudomonas quasicaspiana]